MSIPLVQRLVALLFSTGLLVLIVQLIRTRRLREEYALIWLAAGVTIFVLSLFGGLVNWLADALRVRYPPTLILVAGLLFTLVILLSQSVTLSTQADRLRDLTQYVALLEARLVSSAGAAQVGAGEDTVDGAPTSSFGSEEAPPDQVGSTGERL